MIPEPTWPEVERRKATNGEREAFDLAVEKAAEIAAQSVARIHRHRILWQAALIGGICAVAIMLPVAVALYNSANTNSRANAHYDCVLFTQAATNMADFIQSDSALRVAQNQTGLAKDIVGALRRLVGAQALVQAQAANQEALSRALTAWAAQIANLRALGATNCQRFGG